MFFDHQKFEDDINRATCTHDYFDIYAEVPSFKTIALSFAIFVLAITIECIVHSPAIGLSFKSSQAQAQEVQVEVAQYDPTEPSSIVDTNDSPTQTRTYYTTPPEKPFIWWTRNPSPSMRANRLAIATAPFVLLVIAFAFRAIDFAPPYVTPLCVKYLADHMHPHWGAVVPLTIIPFILGCAAWCRALVDCLLVRSGKRLGYPGDEEGIEWPPCAPVVFPILLVVRFARWSAVAIMGGKGKDVRREEGVELGEEGMGLVAGVDGAGDEELGRPPSYESSWGEERLRGHSNDAQDMIPKAPVGGV